MLYMGKDKFENEVRENFLLEARDACKSERRLK